MDVRYPIGELQIPDPITLEQVQEWLKDIETFPARLKEAVDGLSGEDLDKTYREGAWTVRQLVHHIADAQLNIYIRMKLALTEDNPSIPAFDENVWAVLPDAGLPVEASLKIIEGLNARIAAYARTLTEEQLHQTYRHQINGNTTVAAELAKCHWHEEHHLAHIPNRIIQINGNPARRKIGEPGFCLWMKGIKRPEEFGHL